MAGLALAAWFAWDQLTGPSCNDEYCATDLGVGAPEGFAFVSDAYAFEGTPPEVPEGGSIEIEIPLSQDVAPGADVQFYRFIADSSAWEVIGPAIVDTENGTASGSFSSVPETIVLMQRNSPAGRIMGYLDPGDALHPSAAEHLTVLHTRDFQPAADGTIAGQLSPLPQGTDADQAPVIAAGEDVEGTLPALDAILAESSSRTNHVQQIVDLVTSEDLEGINLAYMDLRADQRVSYGLLVEELARALEEPDVTLSLTLPPPIVTSERVDTGAVRLGRSSGPRRTTSTWRPSGTSERTDRTCRRSLSTFAS
ncbi:MAG: hypothetical protein U5Q44_03875 [Dehalococcoidia bacterium]|nr:hypothetical protein [Dehalococcoidia bacterium]